MSTRLRLNIVYNFRGWFSNNIEVSLFLSFFILFCKQQLLQLYLVGHHQNTNHCKRKTILHLNTTTSTTPRPTASTTRFNLQTHFPSSALWVVASLKQSMSYDQSADLCLICTNSANFYTKLFELISQEYNKKIIRIKF